MKEIIKNILIGVAVGYVLNLVYKTLELPAGVSIPVLDREVGIVYLIGVAVAGFGFFKRRSLMWIGLGMLLGIYLRDRTAQ